MREDIGMDEPDFNHSVGMEFIDREDDASELRLEVAHRHMSAAARVHGGVLFTMIDTAMGRAVVSCLPAGKGCATIEAKINYFRPVQQGSLRAIARCTNVSRRTAYTEAEVRDQDDRLIAKATATFMLTDSLLQTDRERV